MRHFLLWLCAYSHSGVPGTARCCTAASDYSALVLCSAPKMTRACDHAVIYILRWSTHFVGALRFLSLQRPICGCGEDLVRHLEYPNADLLRFFNFARASAHRWCVYTGHVCALQALNIAGC